MAVAASAGKLTLSKTGQHILLLIAFIFYALHDFDFDFDSAALSPYAAETLAKTTLAMYIFSRWAVSFLFSFS